MIVRNLKLTLKIWTICGVALISFSAGMLLNTRLTQVGTVRADTERLFELRVYHTVPGKLQTMESRFRNTTSKLLMKHHLNVLGYWTSDDISKADGTFIFLLAHKNADEAKTNWDAMGSDPAFQEVIKSEQAEKTLERAEVIHMRPTDFSPMK